LCTVPYPRVDRVKVKVSVKVKVNIRRRLGEATPGASITKARRRQGRVMEIKPKRTWRPLIKLKKRWRHKWRTPMEVKVHLKGLQEACSKPWELEDIYFLFL